MLRFVRAALIISAFWALAWLPVGLAVGLYAASGTPDPSDFIARPVSLAAFVGAWTAWGAASGLIAAVILGFAERRRNIDGLSPVRFAIWGALGAMAVPATLTVWDFLRLAPALRGYGWQFPAFALAVSGALGAGCAIATLAIARR